MTPTVVTPRTITRDCPRCTAPGATLTPDPRDETGEILNCPECGPGQRITRVELLRGKKPTRTEIQLRRKAHARRLKVAEPNNKRR